MGKLNSNKQRIRLLILFFILYLLNDYNKIWGFGIMEKP